ncbi:aspartic peptidase domain-containing protein [Dichomitus squalens]|uniref:Aspartic peptidase domain-containing protein n=1 Tax=Dichomitus squalens TaxID=114155 RepID=A0A4V2K178_9APHY|nr:aspartic peptidase domain-containing protein [Dichomitus squalens]
MVPSSLLKFAPLVTAGAALGQSFSFKAHGTGYKSAYGSLAPDNVGVSTSNDLLYTVEITLGGQNFTVQLDTGSSDLWLNTAGRAVQLTNATDLAAEEAYGSGQAAGSIAFAELRIGDFTLPSQAFLNATAIQDMDLSEMDGIMGMAFDVASIYGTVQKAWGTAAADALARAPMTALFAQDPALPDFFDVQLGRTTELDDVADGTFLISAHAAGFEDVADAPRLPRVAPEHWGVVLDAMVVDGESFAFNASRIKGVPAGKVVAVLDTGFSFPPLPAPAVDAIYGGIPGAVYDESSAAWLVPCNSSTNLTFVFGGQEFPVHPLDLTFPVAVTLPVNGVDTNVTACLGTYQYLTLDPSSFVGFDIILGDAFLRSVYASFNYGDWDPMQNTDGTPYVQMLATTDPATMWDEFQTERAATLAQLPPALDPSLLVQYEQQAAAASSTQSTADPSSPTDSSSGGTQGEHDELAKLEGAVSSDPSSGDGSGDSWGKKYGTLALGLLGANLLVGVVLLGVTVTMCVRGMKGRSAGSRYTPVRFKDGGEDYERGAMGRYSD